MEDKGDGGRGKRERDSFQGDYRVGRRRIRTRGIGHREGAGAGGRRVATPSPTNT